LLAETARVEHVRGVGEGAVREERLHRPNEYPGYR
jgi:hypothetical protein